MTVRATTPRRRAHQQQRVRDAEAARNGRRVRVVLVQILVRVLEALDDERLRDILAVLQGGLEQAAAPLQTNGLPARGLLAPGHVRGEAARAAVDALPVRVALARADHARAPHQRRRGGHGARTQRVVVVLAHHLRVLAVVSVVLLHRTVQGGLRRVGQLHQHAALLRRRGPAGRRPVASHAPQEDERAEAQQVTRMSMRRRHKELTHARDAAQSERLT